MSIDWNGEGLPPVGCECDVKSGKNSWTLCRVVHSSEAGVAFIYLEEPSPELLSQSIGVLDSIPRRHAKEYFSPNQAQAERKRDEAITAMRNFATNYNNTAVIHAIEQVYDSIAAGKIPHITLK